MDSENRLTGVRLRSAVGLACAALLGGCGAGDSASGPPATPQLKPLMVACGQDANPRYKVTLLDSLGGLYSGASAINNRGQVVGYAHTPAHASHAMIWDGATATDLSMPGEMFSAAYAINEAGTAVGVSWDNRGYSRPVSWSGADVTYLPTPPNGVGTAFAINNSGQIAGESELTVNGTPRPSSWTRGTLVTMPTLGGAVGLAFGINDLGAIVGYTWTADSRDRAALWVDGTAVDLGTLGGPDSQAYAINNHGQVVGASSVSHGSQLTTHAFFWYKGNITDLGTLGGTFSRANAINNSGQIVGVSTGPDEQGRPAIWRDPAAAPVDLRTLVDESAAGIRIDAPAGINDHGQIAATALLQDGTTRAVVLTPTACN